MAKKSTTKKSPIDIEIAEIDKKYKTEEENLIARETTADKYLIKLFQASESALVKIEAKKKELETLIRRSKVEDKVEEILGKFFPSNQTSHKFRKNTRLSDIWQDALKAQAKVNNAIAQKLKKGSAPKASKKTVLDALEPSHVLECLKDAGVKASTIAKAKCFRFSQIANAVKEKKNVSLTFNDLMADVLEKTHIREVKSTKTKTGAVKKTLHPVVGARTRGKTYVYLESGLK